MPFLPPNQQRQSTEGTQGSISRTQASIILTDAKQIVLCHFTLHLLQIGWQGAALYHFVCCFCKLVYSVLFVS